MRDHPHHPLAPQVDRRLRAALATRDRHAAGLVSDHGLAVARRFATHLTAEFGAVFSFLFDPSLDATNWRAGTRCVRR